MGADILGPEAVEALRRALDNDNVPVTALVQRALALAQGQPETTVGGDTPSEESERRLGDRILWAMELAVVQEDMEAAIHLDRAFESAMTRFGGPNRVEKRDVPASMVHVYERLEELRRRRKAASGG